AVTVREDDFHTRSGVAFGYDQLFRDKLSLFIQTHEIDFVDSFAGSRQKHVKYRQCAVDRPFTQLALHLLGDEKTETEQRAHGRFKTSQFLIDNRRAEARQVWDCAHRFETG